MAAEQPNQSLLTSNERVKRYRLKQKKLGRLKREMYLTDTEFKLAKDSVLKFRIDALPTKDES